jgi:hypothetical protein
MLPPNLRLLPCDQNKRPLIAAWEQRASSDRAQLEAWEFEFPGCLWGILCGEAFDVLDVDPAGIEWALEHEADLRTYTQRTRRGGLHLYFQPTPGLTPRTDCPVHGVDVRATGSYVMDWKRLGYPTIERAMLPMPGWLVEAVMRPSLHECPPPAPLLTGTKTKRLPRDLYFQALKLVPLSSVVSRRDQRRVCSVLAYVVQAIEGTRNNRLFWAACRFAEFVSEGWVERVVAERLLMNGAMMCGLGLEETRATISSGLRSAIRGAGGGLKGVL